MTSAVTASIEPADLLAAPADLASDGNAGRLFPMMAPKIYLPAKAERWHTAVTHFRGHIDEIGSWLLLKLFGKDIFPGIDTARLVQWGGSPQEFGYQTINDMTADGYLPIGIWGGMTDEHPTISRPRKKKASSFSLTVELLGLEGEPWLSRIEEAITHEDRKGGGGLLHLATIVKKMHAQFPSDPDTVFNFGEEALLAIMMDQMKFFHETAKEFNVLSNDKNSSRSEVVTGHLGYPLHILMLQTDNEQMPSFASWTKGGGADIFIMVRSTGNVAIFCHKGLTVGTGQMTRMLRLEEARIQNIDLGNISVEETMREGEMRGIPEWNHFSEGGMIFNGSLTHPDVPPTQMSPHHIYEIVKTHVRKGD